LLKCDKPVADVRQGADYPTAFVLAGWISRFSRFSI
jgi:hypothetical protein